MPEPKKKRYALIWASVDRQVAEITEGTVRDMTTQLLRVRELTEWVAIRPQTYGDIRLDFPLIIEMRPDTYATSGFYKHILATLEEILPKKKEISDRCKECNVAGVWGPRAMLLCPICNVFIGGLS